MSDRSPATPADPERPQLIFFCELEGAALARLLDRPGLLPLLAARGDAVALALPELDAGRAEAVRRLGAAGVPVIAWLGLPPDEGLAFNLQNYPRAAAAYRAFRAWASAEQLTFDAVGLDIEPPMDARGDWRSARELARRLWLARDNALFPAARAAYLELVAAIRHDGYEVHAYQVPLIADDRRAGTTLLQRAFDIVDLPADVDVLLCSSEMAPAWLGDALIAGYGSAADAIAVGVPDERDPALAWGALRRDLLQAGQYVDTIYVATLEACADAGLLERIAALHWGTAPPVALGRLVLALGTRSALLGLLVAARFGLTGLAWAGWALAIFLWLRLRRAARRTGSPRP